MQNYDVAIVGAGMVGLTMALCLKGSGLEVIIIDSQSPDRGLSDSPETRVSAINLASETLFKNLQVWQQINPSRARAYDNMEVWEQDSFGRISFSNQDVGHQHLGTIVENQAIILALLDQIQQTANIEQRYDCRIAKLRFGQQESFIQLEGDDAISAKLVIGADGANSLVRKQAGFPITFWDYEHVAIVATVKTELAHAATARQAFTPHGPLAFLPLSDPNLCSIVWSQQSAQANALLAMSDTEFSHAVTVAIDGQLGVVELCSERHRYPLRMRYCRQWVRDRAVVIGDAAHTIHPLAGQGANLGLGDAAALAQLIRQLAEAEKDIGLATNLRSFERWRKTEAIKMIATMEGFKRLFSGSNPLKKIFRDTGMMLVDKAGPVKQGLIRQAAGLDGTLPELAKPALKQD